MLRVVYPRCAGIDIAKKEALVCVSIADGDDPSDKVETWGATSVQVLALAERLAADQITRVVMEATGDYWKKFFFLLQESGFDVVLVNPRQVRAMPGRKTDVLDCQRLAEAAALDMVKPSFVPAPAVRELRDLVRSRTIYTRDRGKIAQRVEKLLESASVALSGTVSDIFGVTGRAILDGLARGETDPNTLASMKRSCVRATRDELIEALTGGFTSHHRFELASHLRVYDLFTAEIENHNQRIAQYFDPDDLPTPVVTARWAADAAAIQEALCAIPGIGPTAAQQILAEIGTDLSSFPDAKHFVSWAGLAPGANQSGGKAKPAKTREGSGSYLKGVMGQVALSAGTREKNTFWAARYRRVASRRGSKKALGAVAAGILTAIYHIIHDGEVYQDLGVDYYIKHKPQRAIRKAIHTLTAADCTITTNPDGTITITPPQGKTLPGAAMAG